MYLKRTSLFTLILLSALLLYYPILANPVFASEIFYDDFDDSREVWEVVEEVWEIIQESEDNKVYKVGFDPVETRALVVSGSETKNWDDYTLQGKMLSKNGVDQYFWFRVSPDNRSYYMVDLRAAGWIDSNNIRVIKKIDDDRVWLHQVNPPKIGCSILHDEWYDLKISVEGNFIVVKIRCPQSDSFTEVFSLYDNDNPLMKGGIGLSAWSGSWRNGVEKWFDEIRVTTEETESAPSLIIIPGLGASWSTRAIVYDENVPLEAWKMTPFVNTYERIIKTAEGSGYTLGENLFVWNYDWRKPLSQIALNLDQFIQSEPALDSSEKIDLVGHSLGGLVARTWVQSYDNGEEKKANNLITAGSPHQGAVQAYQAIAGGKISEGASLGWTALQLLLQIKEGLFKTQAEIFRNAAPICYDLVPVFNFINRCGQEEINFMEIAYPNNFLFQLNQEADVLSFSRFLVGNNGSNTPEMIFVEDRSVIEEVLNLWPDGKPYKIAMGEGDNTVLKRSAYLVGGFEPDLEYPLNHGEIISSPEAVEKIMTILGNDSPVILGSDPYPEDSLLIFYLASPATLEVEGLIPEDDDLQFVVIPNPEPRQYQATVTGTGGGLYRLFVGQITPRGNFWQSYQGEAENGKAANYLFDINPENPFFDPLVDLSGLTRLEEARELLKDLYQKVFDKNISKSLAQLNSAIKMAGRSDWRRTINDLKRSMFYLSNFRRDQTETEYYAESKIILEKIAFGWENILRANGLESGQKAKKEYLNAKKEYFWALKSIDRSKMRGKEITERVALSVKDSEELIDDLKERLAFKDFTYLESHAYLAYLFAREGV